LPTHAEERQRKDESDNEDPAVLRPDTVIEYVKARAARHLSDFEQHLNGLNVGGRLVVGGLPAAAAHLRSVAKVNRSLGVIVSINEIHGAEKLDVNHTYSFDLVAVAQLLMTGKNEAFHQTIDQSINLIQRLVVDEGQPIEAALQVLREQADKIGHL